MIEKNNELIDEFYNLIKDDYPDLSLEEVRKICFTPWKFLKQEMESDNIPEVRFKYFGTFKVYKGRAENMLYNIKQMFKFRKIQPDRYHHLKDMLENYLKTIQDDEKEN